MSLFAELSRRNVLRMAGLYVVGAWVIVQVADTLLPLFNTPDWVMKALVALLVIGFIPTLVFSWVFELTPDGFKRDSQVPPEQSIGHQTARRMDQLTIAGVVIAVLLVGADRLWPAMESDSDEAAGSVTATSDEPANSPDNKKTPTTVPTEAVSAKSVAVLPFENFSTDPENAYFADGIQDEILTGLAQISELKVISRTSTARYASRPDNIAEIASQLGVAHIVEGSVQRAGNRVRVNVQLIDARSDSHLWAESYDRDLNDVFAVQSEVAQKVADSLSARLTRDERNALAKQPTDNAEAYNAFLRARALSIRVNGSREEAERMLDAYREAVRLDPGFTLAWAELAREAIRTHWLGFDPDGSLREEATRALDRARSLASGLPQVALVDGVYQYYIERDFSGAMQTLNEVKQRLPNDAEAWMTAGYLARRLGLWDAAIADMIHATRLAPNDYSTFHHLAITHVASGHCEKALPVFDIALSLRRGDNDVLAQKTGCLWQMGKLAEAERLLESQSGDSAILLALRAQHAELSDDPEKATDLYRQAIQRSKGEHVDFYFAGYIRADVYWRIRLAMMLPRGHGSDEAEAEFRGVRDAANTALASSNNTNVTAAWSAALGFALVGLGEGRAGVAAGQRMVALVPTEKDTLEGPVWFELLVRIQALNGDTEDAVAGIRILLESNNTLISQALLPVDPDFNRIRYDPAFQALLDNAATASDPE
ncbi:MAG: hypothetical protein R3F22_02370 [Lysobacteraceae bacterium]